MLKQSIVVSVLLVAALVAGGCSAGGGAKDVAEVKTCLEKLDLKVDASSTKKDKDVKAGVFASSDLTKEGDEITIAVAAEAKTQAAVDRFEADTKEFADQLKESNGKELIVDSGTDGTYVWVVMGDEQAKVYKDARACVQP